MIKIKSPGRVNLIGEHTDYTGGHVMPFAIDLDTSVKGGKNDCIDVYSKAFNKREKFEIDELEKEDDWTDHIKGVYSILKEEGYDVGGIKAKFEGDLPIGSGLSASASFELAVMYLLDELYDLGISRKEMALLCQKVENEYIGVSCGIMDQFSIALGKKGKAMHIDTDTLECEYVGIPEELRMVVFHTGVKRELKSSEYNDRREEVEEAMRSLEKESSKDVNLKDLEQLSEMERKRLGYIVRENDRVLEAKEALEEDDLEKLGEILTEAHEDIAENYEASCEELDFLVEKSNEHGALGARLTGAGWGGAAIALWKGEGVDDFAEQVFNDYKENFSREDAEYYIVKASEGVRKAGE